MKMVALPTGKQRSTESGISPRVIPSYAILLLFAQQVLLSTSIYIPPRNAIACLSLCLLHNQASTNWPIAHRLCTSSFIPDFERSWPFLLVSGGGRAVVLKTASMLYVLIFISWWLCVMLIVSSSRLTYKMTVRGGIGFHMAGYHSSQFTTVNTAYIAGL